MGEQSLDDRRVGKGGLTGHGWPGFLLLPAVRLISRIAWAGPGHPSAACAAYGTSSPGINIGLGRSRSSRPGGQRRQQGGCARPSYTSSGRQVFAREVETWGDERVGHRRLQPLRRQARPWRRPTFSARAIHCPLAATLRALDAPSVRWDDGGATGLVVRSRATGTGGGKGGLG
jgi:hypothetical protein